MKDIIPAKKESPILGLTGMGGGVGSNIVAGGEDVTKYIDDVFNTYLWNGVSDAAQNISSGLDMTKGGMVWNKRRDSSGDHVLIDTERGANYALYSNTTNTNQYITSGSEFTNTGFTFASENNIHPNNSKLATWTFRKQKGFFDVVTYTGTGSARTVAHNLGSVPGMILVKRRDSSDNWNVYHCRSHSTQPAGYYLELNSSSAIGGASNRWNNTPPTATEFTVGTAPVVNANGGTFIAYLFAGGESTAATATSVALDGNDRLSVPDSTDFDFGSGDFTIEYWAKGTDLNNAGAPIGQSVAGASTDYGHTSSWQIWTTGDNHAQILLKYSTGGSGWSAYATTTGVNVNDGQWHHYAYVRNSTVVTIYVDGTENAKVTVGNNALANGSRDVRIGEQPGQDGSSGTYFEGSISNIRVVKGTAVYTSSFKPPTEPLTNITNTKLLCCQGSTTTAATVIPSGSITEYGNPTASTDSPFDDPAGFKFGDDEDQNLIKCGSYTGNGNGSNTSNFNGPKINLGWEPQWVLVKNTQGSNWNLFDSMRGISTTINDQILYPSGTWGEDSLQFIDITPTGFNVVHTDASINGSGHNMIYIAIRRPDGLVGKPAKAGTDVFAIDNGASSNNIPNFDSGFPVDMAMDKNINSSSNWDMCARLIQGKYVQTQSGNAEGTMASLGAFDSNTGWQRAAYDSNWYSWMWKRHAGFDVVTYKSPGGDNFAVNHSLGRVPEMMWIKRRFGTNNFTVYHKGLNGGTNPENYGLHLNTAGAQIDDYGFFADIAPNATTFQVGYDATTGSSGESYLAMLFASVNGISKVGSYTGSSSALTITTGFSPRYVMIKNRTNTGNNWTTGWFTFDTTRGWAAGNNDKRIRFNDTAQQSTEDWTNPTSTGFTLNDAGGNVLNNNGEGYIYYAHA